MNSVNNGFFMPVKLWALTETSFQVWDHMETVQDSTVMNTLRKLGNFFLVAAANLGISLVNSLLGRVGLHRDFMPKEVELVDLNMNPVVEDVEKHRASITLRQQEVIDNKACFAWFNSVSSF